MRSPAFDEQQNKKLPRPRGRRKRRKKRKTLDEIVNELHMDAHRISLEKLCKRYTTDLDKGLTSEIAQERIEVFGFNRLTPTTAGFGFCRFFKAIFGGFSLLLWGGVILSFSFVLVDASLTDQKDLYVSLGCILILIAIINGCISYYQQSKSSKIISAFKKKVPQYADVTRNGHIQRILAEELAKGDLVSVKLGDRIPADIRVVKASSNFKVDMSVLTGENEPQIRTPECTSENPLETLNLAFFSTTVVEGSGNGIVINVGDDTVVGRIVGLASNPKAGETHVAKEIRRLIRFTTLIAIFLGIIFFSIGLGLGTGIIEHVIGVVGIIVANVPEGLPVTVTICLTLIAKRMGQKNLLVTNLSAVENLGATSIIITDKTGILTQNKMTVAHLWFNNQIFESGAVGRSGGFVFESDTPGFDELSRCAILCGHDEERTLIGGSAVRKSVLDASELALDEFMLDAVPTFHWIRRGHPVIHEIRFNSTNKYHVTIHRLVQDGQSRALLIMKGAPERVFDFCSTIMMDGMEYFIDEEWREAFETAYAQTGGKGERVLGFCDIILPQRYAEPGFVFDAEEPNFPLNSLRFVGMISMIDPPRPSVPHAISVCKSAGIKIVMMTGDHPTTARAVAETVGIFSNDYQFSGGSSDSISHFPRIRQILPLSKSIVIHGGQLKTMTNDELDDILENYDGIVFARTTPRQKLILVDACQRSGAVVAVTGISPFDPPSLQKADIGIATANTGSDSTKQAADIILLDDNFATIVTGIEESRLIFDNLKKCISYVLTSNVPEMTPIFMFIIIGIPLPVGIITILCIDLGTDLIPAISIAYEMPESDMMKRKPRDPRDRLVNRRVLISCLNKGVIEALAGFFTYFVIMAENGFLPWDLIHIREQWDSKFVNDLTDSYGQQWTYGARVKLLYTCQTGFFVAVVIAQWANLIVCKTRRNSCCHQGMRNWVLNFALVFETCLAALLTYTPGTQTTLKTYPLEWVWWTLALPFSILMFVFEEIRHLFIRHYEGGWVKRETYY